jgi:DNA-binding GntR family transcriptional regulator
MDTGLHTAPSRAVPSRAGRAYEELKTRLLAGDFRLNVRLAETRLAALLGVSRTPVREALLRLHAEGLVSRSTDGGFEPKIPDVAATRWLYEVRAGLEIQALRRPAQLGTTHDLDQLRTLRSTWAGLVDLDADPSFVLLDEAFHVGLAEAAGNPPLADLLRQVNQRIRTVRMQDFLTADRVAATAAEHVAIVDAVLTGDLGAAESRFTAHLDRSVAVVEARVARAIARMVVPEEAS